MNGLFERLFVRYYTLGIQGPKLQPQRRGPDLYRELDEAVAAAYGWRADLSEDEILKRLLELNQERAAATAVR